MSHVLQRRQRISRPIDEVFAFFANAGNLDLLTPSWLNFEIRTPSPIAMGVGTRIEYAIRWHGLPLRWLTEILEWVPGDRFVDTQLRGPYRLWHHTHRFKADGDQTIMEDIVRYALPLGPIGRLAHAMFVQRDVQRIISYCEPCSWRRCIGFQRPTVLSALADSVALRYLRVVAEADATHLNEAAHLDRRIVSEDVLDGQLAEVGRQLVSPGRCERDEPGRT